MSEKNMPNMEVLVDKKRKRLTRGRLAVLHRDSNDRLERLNNVVKQWTCSHCKRRPPSSSSSSSESESDDDELDNLDVSTLPLSKEAQLDLDNELRLFVTNLNLISRDMREKNFLRSQTIKAKEICDQQREHTNELIGKIMVTEEILR